MSSAEDQLGFRANSGPVALSVLSDPMVVVVWRTFGKAAAEAYVALDEDYGSLPFGDSRLAELFDCLNDKYFGGELPPIQVRVGIPWEADEWRGTNGLARFDRTQLFPKPGGDIKIYLADFLFSVP